MAFDNYFGKDRRRPYYGSRSFDRQCRHQGSCTYCENRRTFASKRRAPIVEKEYANIRTTIYF